MLPSPAVTAMSFATTPGDASDVAGRWRGGPATDGTGDDSPLHVAAQRTLGPAALAGPAALTVGGCCACQLPLDATCAAQSRDTFREAAAVLGLPGDMVYDGMTMASELAANTLHAHDNVESDDVGPWPLAGAPELWIYLRGMTGRWELVCKVFDSLRGWKDGVAPAPGSAALDAESGRGLQVVAELSRGRWGHHLTRSRLGGWRVPGKAVWFSLPLPGDRVPGRARCPRLAPGQVGRALEAMLIDRGLGRGLLRSAEPGNAMSVLSVRCGLSVWCRDSMIWWQDTDGRYEQRLPADLVDTSEKIVCTCEELECGLDNIPAGLGRTGR
jgi:hypothetical protein